MHTVTMTEAERQTILWALQTGMESFLKLIQQSYDKPEKVKVFEIMSDVDAAIEKLSKL